MASALCHLGSEHGQGGKTGRPQPGLSPDSFWDLCSGLFFFGELTLGSVNRLPDEC
jgi:hypothetical protein